jgi:hypothetical protein
MLARGGTPGETTTPDFSTIRSQLHAADALEVLGSGARANVGPAAAESPNPPGQTIDQRVAALAVGVAHF